MWLSAGWRRLVVQGDQLNPFSHDLTPLVLLLIKSGGAHFIITVVYRRLH